MPHTTAEPDGVSDKVKANRLADDLRDSADAEHVRVRQYERTGRTAVRFEIQEERCIPPSIMRILAEHNAELRGSICLESGGTDCAKAYV